MCLHGREGVAWCNRKINYAVLHCVLPTQAIASTIPVAP